MKDKSNEYKFQLLGYKYEINKAKMVRVPCRNYFWHFSHMEYITNFWKFLNEGEAKKADMTLRLRF